MQNHSTRNRIAEEVDPLRNGIQFSQWASGNLAQFTEAVYRELKTAADDPTEDALLGLLFSILKAREEIHQGTRRAYRRAAR